jgi:hypothetical protein
VRFTVRGMVADRSRVSASEGRLTGTMVARELEVIQPVLRTRRAADRSLSTWIVCVGVPAVPPCGTRIAFDLRPWNHT